MHLRSVEVLNFPENTLFKGIESTTYLLMPMMTTPIPKPRGLPLLGNILNIDVNNTWVSLQKLWEKYGRRKARRPSPFR